jgi:agmatine deiminase
MEGRTPIEDGYYMPGEYEPHLGTLMIYPVRPGSWGRDRSDTLRSFGQVFSEIMKREDLYILVDPEHREEAEGFFGELIENNGISRERCHVLTLESDDSWARDVGPTFVVDGKRNLRGINWCFNAWGGEVDGLYSSWDKDDKVAVEFCRAIGISFYDAAPFVLEGGSIHSDGEGTVMVTESCLLSSGRNPELTKQEIEEKLRVYLGAEKVLWLPRGIYNDETNEHVDNVCAFTAPGEVVLAWTDDVNDPQYAMSLADLEYLESVTDAKGRKIRVHKLPVPAHPVLVAEDDLSNYEFEEGEDTREVGERLAASYVNFYFVNGAALVPQFGGENAESDAAAVSILQGLLPDREVIGIDARPILLGGGNIHCITQQIPAAARDALASSENL